MNYYYDVVLNFSLDEIWNFYEWEEYDELLTIKKIPLYRVSLETIYDFMKYQIEMDMEFVQKIAHKTILKLGKDEIYAAFVMSDSKNSLAVLLNESGNVIALSKLLLYDDNNLNEFMFTMKEKVLLYEKKLVRKERTGNRQSCRMKNLIQIELNTLENEKNIQKLSYLYYEWFNEEETDFNKMLKRMRESLLKNVNESIELIYYFIRLSYHQV